MATSVQHVLTSVFTYSQCCCYSSCMKRNCKLIENVCNWPHYVIKFTQSECSFWHSPGHLSVLLWLHSLQYHTGNHHFGLWVSQPIVRHTTRESSRLHSRTVCGMRGEYWAEEAGCNFLGCGSQKKSTLPSEAFLFTLTLTECCSPMLLRHVFLYPVIALSAVLSHVYPLPLRMPCRWCLLSLRAIHERWMEVW